MNAIGASSDQSDTWSALHAGRIRCRLATAPQNALASAAPAGGRAAWLAHRALQALRETGLQVCSRARPRAKVLSFGESCGRTPRDGLRAPGDARPSRAVSGQSPPSARGPRGDLRDQPRAPAPARGVLSHAGERRHPPGHRPLRHPICRHPHRQHARGMARDRRRLLCHRGGTR